MTAHDEQTEARFDIANEIAEVMVGVGYYSTRIGMRAALEVADILIAEGWLSSVEVAARERAAAERAWDESEGTRGFVSHHNPYRAAAIRAGDSA